MHYARATMNRAAPEPLRIDRSTSVERAEALSLALAEPTSVAEKQQVAQWTEAMESSAGTLWVGYRGKKLVVAMLAQIQPGRTATVLPPRVVAGESPEAAGKLLAAVVSELARLGIQVVQALLETDSGLEAQALCKSGFAHASDLLYLVSLPGEFPTSLPEDGLEFVPCEDAWHDRLASVVARTYEGSLDCPQLDRVREIDDVLAGYRAIGEFDPARWLFVRKEATDVGCLLLADHPSSNAWELVYLGVVATMRGRGYGVAIARFAQWLTGRAGRERLFTAVDAENCAGDCRVCRGRIRRLGSPQRVFASVVRRAYGPTT